MNRSDLAEIRAQLQASAAADRARQPRPRFGAFRFLLGGSADEHPGRAHATEPLPRRAGPRPAETVETEAAEPLVLSRPAPADAPLDPLKLEPAASLRRNAFGQRRERAQARLAPLQLFAPEPTEPEPPAVDSDPAPVCRPQTIHLPEMAPETPYMADDLSDAGEADAERLYAASGLFDHRPTPLEPPAETDPERELLSHLERVFVAEQAALRACMAGAV